MELKIGDVVTITNGNGSGGEMTATLTSFERDGNVAVFTPNEFWLRHWFPNGYMLGKAHWDTRIKKS